MANEKMARGMWRRAGGYGSAKRPVIVPKLIVSNGLPGILCDECYARYEPMTDSYKCPCCGTENYPDEEQPMNWKQSLAQADLPLLAEPEPPAEARCVRVAAYRGEVSHARAIVGTEPNSLHHINALARRASRASPGRILVFLCEVESQWLIYDVQRPDSVEQALATPVPEQLGTPEDQAAVARLVDKAKALLQHCSKCDTDTGDCVAVLLRRDRSNDYEETACLVCKGCRKALNGRFKKADEQYKLDAYRKRLAEKDTR